MAGGSGRTRPLKRTSAAGTRHRPVSCYFCRSRKLRCSRESPCSNCASRGIDCGLYPREVDERSTSPQPTSTSSITRKDALYASTNNDTSLYPTPAATRSVGILGRLRRLEDLVLARHGQRNEDGGLAHVNAGDEDSMDSQPGVGSPQTELHYSAHQHIRQELCVEPELVWMAETSMGYGSNHVIPADRIMFLIRPMGEIPVSPSFTRVSGHLCSPNSDGFIRCIWLPRYEETKVHVQRYIKDITYVHHVIHTPTLCATVGQLYADLSAGTQVKIEKASLVLSILASVACLWTSDPSSVVDSNTQGLLWIKATLDVLEHSQRSSNVSIETVQAIIIVAFAICNLEGVSQRYRAMMSTALSISRGLEFHRLDLSRPVGTMQIPKYNNVERETARRVWWYLASTDWFSSNMAGPSEGIYTVHPGHMVVEKPLNVDDKDLIEGQSLEGMPSSEPTTMSYFLQRVRLAEICRNAADRGWSSRSEPDSANYSNVIQIDVQLKAFSNNLPPFFVIGSRNRNELAQEDPMIRVQRYFINSLLHTQRCKMHLPYVARELTDPMCAYSRHACLEAARLIVQNDLQLAEVQVQFALTRLKYSARLFGLFMANIVFLLDTCLNRSSGLRQPQRVEAIEAFRILGEAKHHSPIAATFWDNMVHFCQKNRIQLPLLHSLDPARECDTDPASSVSETGVGLTEWAETMEQGSQQLMNWVEEFSRHFKGPDAVLDGEDWTGLLGDFDFQPL